MNLQIPPDKHKLPRSSQKIDHRADEGWHTAFLIV